MKKYSIIFMLSFISYFLVLLASPYITARTWADVCFGAFLLSAMYQLSYIIFLRKKDSVSLGRSISRTFLYAFFAGSGCIVFDYIYIFINGQYETGFFGDIISGPYYGFETWKYLGWENIFFMPLLIIFSVYEIAYFVISKKLKRHE